MLFSKENNTNGCQFGISFEATSHLDETNVVFGKAIEGLDVLKKIESVRCKKYEPSKKVLVTNCGQSQ